MNRVSDSKALTEWMELARVLGAKLFELWERPTGGSGMSLVLLKT